MEDLRELQKEEALQRMKILKEKSGLLPEIVKDFKNNNIVYYSEDLSGLFKGCLYWITNRDDFVEIIKQFEKDKNALVYHAILSHTIFGDLLSLLYVSEYQEEWEQEKQDLKENYCFSYVINLDDDCCSEFGSIAITGANGGLTRMG